MSFNLDHEMDRFCAKVSVAQGLDEEIRDEMRAHLREKIDYYLDKRQLSDEEAFRLASMAMGNPEEMAAQMRSVYPVEATATKAFSLIHILGCLACVSVLHRALGAFVSHVILGNVDLVTTKNSVTEGQVAVTTVRLEAYDTSVILLLLSMAAVFWVIARPLTRQRAAGGRSRLVAYIPLALLGVAALMPLFSTVIPSWNLLSLPQAARAALRVLHDSTPYGTVDTSLAEIASRTAITPSSYIVGFGLFLVKATLLAGFCCLLARRLGLAPRKQTWAAFVPLAWLAANEIAAAGGMWSGAALVAVGLSPRYWNSTLLDGWSVSGMLMVVLALTALGCALGWAAFNGYQHLQTKRVEIARN